MSAYYNEIDPYAAQWLRNLIKAGHIADGEIDTRSIVDVSPDDIRGFTQAHFFAGLGGWSHALRLAGWPDDRPIWTGSAPCQPFSAAGTQLGQADERHLWPTFFDLIRVACPPVLMGEQVAAAVGKGWLDGVFDDLEGVGYACRATVVPACAVDAPHRRDRLWFVADDDSKRTELRELEQRTALRTQEWRGDNSGRYSPLFALADAAHIGRKKWEWQNREQIAGSSSQSRMDAVGNSSFWSDHIWLTGAVGKARRVEPSICLLANGIPNRVGRLRAYGNAIVPQVAAEVIGAYMDCAQVWNTARSGTTQSQA